MNAKLLLIVLPLGLAACNVERDPGNDTTAISVNESKIDKTLDDAGNGLKAAASDVKNAADRAGPALGNAADDVGDAARNAGDKIGDGADKAANDVRSETRDNPPKKN